MTDNPPVSFADSPLYTRGDPSLTALTRWERFCFAMVDLAKRQGWE